MRNSKEFTDTEEWMFGWRALMPSTWIISGRSLELSKRNDLKLVMDTVKKLKFGPTLFHSDQGFQYTTQSYAKLLEEKKLTGNHSRAWELLWQCMMYWVVLLPLKDGEVVFGEASGSGASKEPNYRVYFVLKQGTFPKQTRRPLLDWIQGKSRRLMEFLFFLLSTWRGYNLVVV